MSNQAILGNGCVCDSGCESCDRLAEAFSAMRQALNLPLLFHSGSVWTEESSQLWDAIAGTREATSKVMCDKIRAALKLAEGPTRCAHDDYPSAVNSRRGGIHAPPLCGEQRTVLLMTAHCQSQWCRLAAGCVCVCSECRTAEGKAIGPFKPSEPASGPKGKP